VRSAPDWGFRALRRTLSLTRTSSESVDPLMATGASSMALVDTQLALEGLAKALMPRLVLSCLDACCMEALLERAILER